MVSPKGGKKREEIKDKNQLCDIEDFTDTTPDFRANLLIKNKAGGFSSYQSDYPYRMVKARGSLYSDCGLLTNPNGSKIGVFIRNIYFLQRTLLILDFAFSPDKKTKAIREATEKKILRKLPGH